MDNIRQELEHIAECICDDICKYREEYFGRYEDADYAQERLMAEKCESCPVGRLT